MKLYSEIIGKNNESSKANRLKIVEGLVQNTVDSTTKGTISFIYEFDGLV